MRYSFRAWDEVEEVMRSHMELLHDQQFYGHKDKEYDIFDDRCMKIEACLGLEDADGVPVFENDIIETIISKYDGYAYVVLRNPATAGFVCKPFKVGEYNRKEPKLYSVALPTFDQLKNHQPIVIGNIHQNKDLLIKERD
ncbi:MAG: YopX family protein [Cetobacterium sp.]